MALLKRLGWFGVGAVIGTILVLFFFGDRDIEWSYLPNDRVLTDMKRKQWLFSEEVAAQNNCLQVDSAFYYEVFTESEVDFSHNERGTSQDCKEYKLILEREEGSHVFLIKNCKDSTATVVSWVLPQEVDCE